MGMGDLDDAIREHLELKRKHGASEEEVVLKQHEAQQQGALPREPGAVRADFEQPEVSAAPSAPEPVHDAELSPADEPEPDEVLPEDALELDVPLPEAVAPSELTDSKPASDRPESEPSEVPDEQEGREALNESMLEETPEFLEDTPEQDRLWFEQRPPKDFDFGD
jgi:hypothetical protein